MVPLMMMPVIVGKTCCTQEAELKIIIPLSKSAADSIRKQALAAIFAHHHYKCSIYFDHIQDVARREGFR
jgi:hypothetical protein